MPAKEKNYWWEAVTPPLLQSRMDLPESVEVAVIGGGFTGLSAARALAKRGVQVAVLEAETAGWGASSRNGGMVLTGLKLPVPTLIRRYGKQAVERMYAISLESIDCVEQIMRVRHHSLYVPRDFDVSPYFEIVKPSLVESFDYRALNWVGSHDV